MRQLWLKKKQHSSCFLLYIGDDCFKSLLAAQTIRANGHVTGNHLLLLLASHFVPLPCFCLILVIMEQLTGPGSPDKEWQCGLSWLRFPKEKQNKKKQRRPDSHFIKEVLENKCYVVTCTRFSIACVLFSILYFDQVSKPLCWCNPLFSQTGFTADKNK